VARIQKAVHQALEAIGAAPLTTLKVRTTYVQDTPATGHPWSIRALEEAEVVHKGEGLRNQQARMAHEAHVATKAAKKQSIIASCMRNYKRDYKSLPQRTRP